jgi:hypothetical protein
VMIADHAELAAVPRFVIHVCAGRAGERQIAPEGQGGEDKPGDNGSIRPRRPNPPTPFPRREGGAIRFPFPPREGVRG